MKSALILFSALLFASPLSAQYNLGFVSEPDGLVFEVNGQTLSHGAIGGFDTPQLSEIDLNFDGVMDLFVFDRRNDVVRTYLYQSSTGNYTYAPEYEANFPADLKEFALLRDYDCDGFQDIFTYYLAGFRVYRNNGSTPLGFTKVTDKIRSDYGSITTGAFVLAGDIPAITDVDNDGDLDILAFGTVNSENTIEFHRNLSQDLYNSCDSLEFEVVTQCWGNVEEPANSASLSPITCKGIVPPPPFEGRQGIHPGSSILLFDADNDDDKDLVVGDIQTDKVVFAVNVGDENDATIDVNQQTTDFPNSTDPVGMQYLVSGFQIDVDHDGKQDLIMSVNNTIDSSVNVRHMWYYRNLGANAPVFELQTKEFLLNDMLDLGSNASIEVMDVNGDGDQDILLSNDYRRGPTGSTNSRIYYFERQASGTYLLVDEDFANISTYGLQAVTLALGDLDGDGDQDLLLGDSEGHLHYFENTPSGGLASPSLSEPIYKGITNIGSNASPEIADVNGDGLLDLLVGERVGTIRYFENLGTVTEAAFASTATIPNFGGIDVSVDCCVGHAQPRWINDPALANGKHLMVGSDEKKLLFYAVPNDLNAPFTLVDSVVVNAGRLSAKLSDLDGNGVFELIIGTAEGGAKYLTREENVVIGISSPVDQSSSLKLYPNPADHTLHCITERPLNGTLRILGMDGRIHLEKATTPGIKQVLEVDNLKEGLYILTIETETGSIHRSFTILR
ncbi:MAG: T9SS type A sorting domain-containing protein [Flavobacteriales bacterium]|nr:T9SS type A sorting domain-containing protein [Flavobacteriales bacterium]